MDTKADLAVALQRNEVRVAAGTGCVEQAVGLNDGGMCDATVAHQHQRRAGIDGRLAGIGVLGCQHQPAGVAGIADSQAAIRQHSTDHRIATAIGIGRNQDGPDAAVQVDTVLQKHIAEARVGAEDQRMAIRHEAVLGPGERHATLKPDSQRIRVGRGKAAAAAPLDPVALGAEEAVEDPGGLQDAAIQADVAVAVDADTVLGLQRAAIDDGLTGIGVGAVQADQAAPDMDVRPRTLGDGAPDAGLAVIGDRAVDGHDMTRAGVQHHIAARHDEDVGAGGIACLPAVQACAARDVVLADGRIARDMERAARLDEDRTAIGRAATAAGGGGLILADAAAALAAAEAAGATRARRARDAAGTAIATAAAAGTEATGTAGSTVSADPSLRATTT